MLCLLFCFYGNVNVVNILISLLYHDIAVSHITFHSFVGNYSGFFHGYFGYCADIAERGGVENMRFLLERGNKVFIHARNADGVGDIFFVQVGIKIVAFAKRKKIRLAARASTTKITRMSIRLNLCLLLLSIEN